MSKSKVARELSLPSIFILHASLFGDCSNFTLLAPPQLANFTHHGHDLKAVFSFPFPVQIPAMKPRARYSRRMRASRTWSASSPQTAMFPASWRTATGCLLPSRLHLLSVSRRASVTDPSISFRPSFLAGSTRCALT